MSSTDGAACLQACPNCGALVDVHEQEPLEKFHCPTCGTAMRAARHFNHFSIVEVLGSGGMGSVYKALDRNLNRMVALKLLRKELSADENFINKLEDEARITASINHPFVVKVFSFGSDFGQYYIAMELVDKGSLDDLMQLQNRIAELQVLQVGLQVAGGLQAAHESGLIHRDVKPGNILFADAHTAKITDFGLALLAEQEAESRGEIWGTPYYIAPEKLNNQPEDFRSDIYSLGGTLFHAVAGRPPFEAESASLVALKHLKSRAVSLQAFAPDVASETAYVINRMLHKDPNQRYSSYGELIDHLKYAIDTLNARAGKARPQKARVVVESAQQSDVSGALTLLLLVLIVIGAGLAYVFRARIFGGPVQPAVQSALVARDPAQESNLAAAAAYEDARRQIVEGQYATAQDSLGSIQNGPGPEQPLQDWARLHYGMAALLNHQSGESRDAFSRLERDGPYSKDPEQAKLANFFVQTGRFMDNPKTINGSAIKNWNKDSFEDIALFLFGLKDWELGQFDDAGKLFREYLKGSPYKPFQWMTDYQPIARKFVHDYDLYAPLRKELDSGTADLAKLRGDFAQARSQLQTSGKMAEFFSDDTQLSSVKTPVAAAVAAPPEPEAAGAPSPAVAAPAPASVNTTGAQDPAVQDAENRRWQTTLQTYGRLVKGYQFEVAESVLDHVALSDPQLIRTRDLMMQRCRRLVAFRNLLVSDLATRGGYPQPLASRENVSYPRGIVTADASAVQAGTPYGTIAVAWTDFTPETLLTIARYFADATADPRMAGERDWAAATFALETGRIQQARILANLAVRNVPAYQSELAPFTENAAH